MKQIWKSGMAFLLALMLAFALAACGGSSQSAPDLPASSTAESTESSETKNTSETPTSSDAEEPSTAEAEAEEAEAAQTEKQARETLPEDGRYSSKEEVALYLHLYGHLPDNFISKKAAHALGWSGGSLEPYAPGCSIGGSRFSNYEGLLPEKNGRIYQECDIDTMGAKKRGAKRIVWSNDGLIYYTDDHYESFTLLYGEE